MVILEPGLQHVDVEIHAGGRVLLIGGEPFESPILLWWNLVGRDVEELKLAREQWMMGHPRFGTIPSYDGTYGSTCISGTYASFQITFT